MDNKTKLPALYYDKYIALKKTTRKLPHWHQEGKLQFITFHLGDSLPQGVLRDFNFEQKRWNKLHPKPWDVETENSYHKLFSQQIETWMDSGYGSCVFRDASIAKIMEDVLCFFDGERYTLHDYVIMPNHVHVLMEVFSGFQINQILHSWKSFSANKINEILGRTGSLWHEEYYDKIIRDAKHYDSVRQYIRKNVNNGGVRWKKN